MWQDIAYDADENIVSLTVATSDKLLAQNTYSYDGNGQRIEKEELAGKYRIFGRNVRDGRSTCYKE